MSWKEDSILMDNSKLCFPHVELKEKAGHLTPIKLMMVYISYVTLNYSGFHFFFSESSSAW